jgi:formylglycine-generating enzyme required for sulfatase activity
MVFIKAGNFEMGNNNGKADAKPLHTVTLNDFYMGKYEVTQELWQLVMGIEKGRKLDCMQCPVYDVSMEKIQSISFKIKST